MPKLPGKESTRVTLKLEHAEVESFVGVWDRYAHKKVCVIEGCDHVVSGVENPNWKPGGSVGEDLWVTCGKGSGAGVVSDKRIGAGSTDQQIRNQAKGVACVCCVDKITETEYEEARAQYGDPD